MTTFSLFPFTQTIPAANNNPSNDQPLMLENNSSTQGLIGVDHITFGLNDGGTHVQTTFVGVATPTLPAATPLASVAYPSAGTADTAHAQYFYQNPIGTFPLSAVRAYAYVTTPGGNPPVVCTLANSFNVISVTQPGGYAKGNVLVTLPAGILTGINYGVFVSTLINFGLNVGSTPGFTILSATTFQLNFVGFNGTGTTPTAFCFAVIQI